ncbi:hypothetical protein C8R43DRAFT_968629 [Mycena crocata]|nr:hypothetical protein C8R43DRAFT_968629 [Mycena crocata]
MVARCNESGALFCPTMYRSASQQRRERETSASEELPLVAMNSSHSLLPSSQNSPPPSSLPDESRSLRLFCLGLHLTVVLVHLALVGIWARHLERRLVFGLQHQRIMSFLVTAVTTAFGTTFTALLVYVTQTLSMRRNIQLNTTLTATHDNAAAWTGIGTALQYVWYQKSVPASVVGVLTTALYLTNIMVLHITTPALFSVDAFNASHPVDVPTNQSLPGWKWDVSNFTDDSSWSNIAVYLNQASAFLPFLASRPDTLGLSEDTLYDVLPGGGVGSATVAATTFDIKCGSLAGKAGANLNNFDVADGVWRVESADWWFNIQSTQPGLLKTGSFADGETANTLFVYSTLPIVDSAGNNGTSWVNLTKPMNSSVSVLQLFKCWQVVISQNVIVDGETGSLLHMARVDRSHSTWAPYSGPADIRLNDPGILNATNNILVDAWAAWFNAMAASFIPQERRLDLTGPYLSVADQYLIQKLNLLAVDQNQRPKSITLHEVENALSCLVAAFLWTLGQVTPIGLQFVSDGPDRNIEDLGFGSFQLPSIGNPPNRPFLAQGTATVDYHIVEIRLDLSIVAVAGGLVASLALLVLSLPLIVMGFQKPDPSGGGEVNSSIGGSGVLQSIWLYRNHTELEGLLAQVDDPTNENLRRAGMVRTSADGSLRRRKEQ